MKPRAVVFAYHNVGVRCLQVLLARGVEVALVVTHEDSPSENIWFGSVASVAREHGIAVITPADPAGAELREAVAAAQPDFIFSFYYRHMLPVALLALAARARLQHARLAAAEVPRPRADQLGGAARRETETGATLHEMAAKPDAGAILGQTAVPILPDDTAAQVFDKVTVAAEQTLWRVLPALLAGEAPHLPNDLSQGSYFGGRKPEDGRLDWSKPAAEVYNLIRAVAPPYPGAFTELHGRRFVVARARLAAPGSAAAQAARDLPPGLHVSDNALFGVCGDSRAVSILELREQHPGRPDHETVLSPAQFAQFIDSSRQS